MLFFFFFSAFCFVLSSPSKSKQSNKKRIQLLQENLTQSTIGSLSKIIMSLSALKENHLINEYLLSAIYLQGTILYPGDSVVSVPESLSTMTCPLFAVLWKLWWINVLCSLEHCTVHLLVIDYWFIIKGYNLRTARWKRCIGQGMWEGVQNLHEVWGLHCPPISTCSPTPKLLF